MRTDVRIVNDAGIGETVIYLLENIEWDDLELAPDTSNYSAQ